MSNEKCEDGAKSMLWMDDNEYKRSYLMYTFDWKGREFEQWNGNLIV